MFFLQRERRAGTFRLHSGLGGTGKCHAAKRREGRQHREIGPGRARRVSEIIPRRSDAAGRIRDASLSERCRPRFPTLHLAEEDASHGREPRLEGEEGEQPQPCPRSHPAVPGSPFPSHTHHAPAQSRRQTRPGLPGIIPPRCAHAPGPAQPQRQRHLGTQHPKKEAETTGGRCRAPRQVPALRGTESATLVSQSRLVWGAEEGESPAESHHDPHQGCFHLSGSPQVGLIPAAPAQRAGSRKGLCLWSSSSRTSPAPSQTISVASSGT